MMGLQKGLVQRLQRGLDISFNAGISAQNIISHQHLEEKGNAS